MTDVRSVWLLVGSAGATAAVGEFFSAMRRVPPVAFVYAQHFDPQRQQQLLDFSLHNPAFKLTLVEKSHPLRAGEVYMVPPSHRVVFDQGEIRRTASGWRGAHTPDFTELAEHFAASELPARGLIVFSGMGSDGVAALPALSESGATLWAQSPDSAVCAALPRAALDTGLLDGDAQPRQLALMLQHLY